MESVFLLSGCAGSPLACTLATVCLVAGTVLHERHLQNKKLADGLGDNDNDQDPRLLLDNDVSSPQHSAIVKHVPRTVRGGRWPSREELVRYRTTAQRFSSSSGRLTIAGPTPKVSTFTMKPAFGGPLLGGKSFQGGAVVAPVVRRNTTNDGRVLVKILRVRTAEEQATPVVVDSQSDGLASAEVKLDDLRQSGDAKHEPSARTLVPLAATSHSHPPVCQGARDWSGKRREDEDIAYLFCFVGGNVAGGVGSGDGALIVSRPPPPHWGKGEEKEEEEEEDTHFMEVLQEAVQPRPFVEVPSANSAMRASLGKSTLPRDVSFAAAGRAQPMCQGPRDWTGQRRKSEGINHLICFVRGNVFGYDGSRDRALVVARVPPPHVKQDGEEDEDGDEKEEVEVEVEEEEVEGEEEEEEEEQEEEEGGGGTHYAEVLLEAGQPRPYVEAPSANDAMRILLGKGTLLREDVIYGPSTAVVVFTGHLYPQTVATGAPLSAYMVFAMLAVTSSFVMLSRCLRRMKPLAGSADVRPDETPPEATASYLHQGSSVVVNASSTNTNPSTHHVAPEPSDDDAPGVASNHDSDRDSDHDSSVAEEGCAQEEPDEEVDEESDSEGSSESEGLPPLVSESGWEEETGGDGDAQGVYESEATSESVPPLASESDSAQGTEESGEGSCESEATRERLPPLASESDSAQGTEESGEGACESEATSERVSQLASERDWEEETERDSNGEGACESEATSERVPPLASESDSAQGTEESGEEACESEATSEGAPLLASNSDWEEGTEESRVDGGEREADDDSVPSLASESDWEQDTEESGEGACESETTSEGAPPLASDSDWEQGTDEGGVDGSERETDDESLPSLASAIDWEQDTEEIGEGACENETTSEGAPPLASDSDWEQGTEESSVDVSGREPDDESAPSLASESDWEQDTEESGEGACESEAPSEGVPPLASESDWEPDSEESGADGSERETDDESVPSLASGSDWEGLRNREGAVSAERFLEIEPHNEESSESMHAADTGSGSAEDGNDSGDNSVWDDTILGYEASSEWEWPELHVGVSGELEEVNSSDESEAAPSLATGSEAGDYRRRRFHSSGGSGSEGGSDTQSDTGSKRFRRTFTYDEFDEEDAADVDDRHRRVLFDMLKEERQDRYYIKRGLRRADREERELSMLFLESLSTRLSLKDDLLELTAITVARYRGMLLNNEHPSDWDVFLLPAACLHLVARLLLGEWIEDMERARQLALLASMVDVLQDLHEGRWDVDEKAGCAIRIEDLAERVSVKLERGLETPTPVDFVDSFLDRGLDSGKLSPEQADEIKIGASQSIRRWMRQGLLARHPPSCLAMAGYFGAAQKLGGMGCPSLVLYQPRMISLEWVKLAMEGRDQARPAWKGGKPAVVEELPAR